MRRDHCNSRSPQSQTPHFDRGQTIGRLETGSRTVSVGWLNRIAKALDVEAADLVKLPVQSELPVAAILASDGANAPRYKQNVLPPRASAGAISMLVDCSIGDYRAGDEIWCDTLTPSEFTNALNRDVLVPRPFGRFIFGRLIGREGNRLQVLPPGAGGKQQIVEDPDWIGVAVRLVRGI
jgi:hypothetical protein